jgi:inosine/xanthosine triphosphate pyrophosphatase family protein/GNAT superfamily N-acetyltransferase
MNAILHPLLIGTTLLGDGDGQVYLLSALDNNFVAQHGSAIAQFCAAAKCSVGELQTTLMRAGHDRSCGGSLSLCLQRKSEVVAILVATLRNAVETHPFQSVCIEKVLVAPNYRGRRLGVRLVSGAVALYFEALPWLLTVSAVVPSTADARGTNLFIKSGFILAYRCLCGSECSLLEIDRSRYLPFGYAIAQYEGVYVPEVPAQNFQISPNIFYPDSGAASPFVYFATGSPEKLTQYRFLARCFGIALHPVKHAIHLTEPQVEGAGAAAEAQLVDAPLKLFSRFAALQNLYPVMVEDTMLFIEWFNNDFTANPILPGADTKRWWRSLGAAGIIRLMKNADHRRARYACQIGINGMPGRYDRVRYELEGHITSDVRLTSHAVENFPYTNATFFHRIFLPEGATRTLAEMEAEEFTVFDYRRHCFAKAVPYLTGTQSPISQLALFEGN